MIPIKFTHCMYFSFTFSAIQTPTQFGTIQKRRLLWFHFRLPLSTSHVLTLLTIMLNAYAWIFITGIIIFFALSVFLLCFTRSPIELPLHTGTDAEFNDWPVETDELVADLPEDARLSYERAKGRKLSTIIGGHTMCFLQLTLDVFFL